MKSGLISLIIFSIVTLSEANNIIDGYVYTPNASEFGRYGEVPVSLYNGTANISVPLFETEQQGVPFQISLNYDTRGAHVRELPTWVGQEWSLSCGGVINRAVKGMPDEYVEPQHLAESHGGSIPKNYFSSYGRLQSLLESKASRDTLWEDWAFGKYALSPDIFFFNFCGKSGRFILGHDGEWKVCCEENLDVVFDVSDSNNYIYPFIETYTIGQTDFQPKVIKGFTIIDQTGIKYIFGMEPNAIEYSVSRTGISAGNTTEPWSANSWYMTKVEDRFGNVLYEFQYDRGPFIAQAYRNEWNVNRFETNFTSPVYLKRINMFDGRSVVFDVRKGFPTDETCFGMQFYTELVTAEKYGYDFLVRSDSKGRPWFFTEDRDLEHPFKSTGVCYLSQIYIQEEHQDMQDSRVIQLQYDTIGPMMHLTSVLHKTKASSEKIESQYRFMYNRLSELPETLFPAKKDNVNKIDCWKPTPVMIYPRKPKRPNELTENDHTLPHPHRKDSESEGDTVEVTDYSVGMLSDIVYPTGGVVSFSYERNRCSHGVYFFDNNKVLKLDSVSLEYGLRVKSITSYNDTAKSKVLSKREFVYTDGLAFTQERLFGLDSDVQDLPYSDADDYPYLARAAASFDEVPHSFSSHVAYTCVSENLNDSLLIEYKYSSPLITNVGHSVRPAENEWDPQAASVFEAPDNDNDLSFLYGKLLEKRTIKVGYGEVHSQRNSYKYDRNQFVYSLRGGKASKVKFEEEGTASATGGKLFYIYKEYYANYRLSQSEEFTRYGFDMFKTLTTFNYVDSVLSYSYPYGHKVSVHSLQSRKTQFLSNIPDQTDNVVEEYEYEFDRNVKTVTSDLSFKGRPRPIVEERRGIFYGPLKRTRLYQNGTLVNDSEKQYKSFENVYQLAYEIDHSFGEADTLVSYLKYTDKGQPEIIREKGMPKTYLSWTDKNILQGIAASKDSVTDIDNTLLKKPETDAVLLTYRNGMVESMVRTGTPCTYYEYDPFNRLTRVRDADHRTVASYSYHLQENGVNCVKHNVFLDEQGSDSVQSVQYYDGLGRPTLVANNTMNTNKVFVYTMTEYDQFGRESKIWAPVVGTPVLDGSISEQIPTLSRAYYHDSCGYAMKQYDALGRVTKTTQSGQLYHALNKSASVSYSLNEEGDVKQYSCSRMGVSLPYTYYKDRVLTCQTAIDENGSRMEVFKDYRDLTILERRYNGNETIETYYVYNDLGQLVWVLQPKYQEEENLSKFAFHYEYDGEGRVWKKTIPGCDYVEFIEYDKADRVIKMQDGLLRAKGKYRVYEYDGLGRLKRQSIADSIHVEYDEIVNFYDTYDYLDEYSDLIPENVVDDTDLSPLQQHSGIGLLTGVLQRASNGELLLMSYSYDDHGRVVLTKEIGLDKHLAAMGYSYNFAGDLDYDAGDLYRYDKSIGKLNDNSLYSWTKHYFQESNNKLPYRSVIHLVHKGSTRATNDEIMKSNYDDFGHIVANNRSGTAADMSYEYDNLHGWLKQISSASGFSQTLFRETGSNNPRWNGSISAMTWNVGDGKKHTYQYTYDGLNRLTEAVYSSNLDIYDKLRPSKEPGRGTDLSELKGSESFRLIPMERLQGNYSESYSYDKNSNIEWLQRNGTTNTGKGKSIDVLEYSYSGNQLKSVTDYSEEELNYAGAFDFQDKADTEQEYAYNENGAMTKDLNKGITNIEYDLLGNPQKVTFSDMNSIEYVYAADGRKLKTVHITAKKISLGMKCYYSYLRDTTDYINNYVFKNGKPEMYRFPGGYYSFDEEGKMDGCHFYVQDYHGNNRMVVNAYTNEVEQINHYYPYGALMGDISTNPDEQKYKYGGKELDRTYGLDLHDFEARQQDPIIGGRFTSVDPMAEKYYSISPYAYCVGDPINCIDPDGRDAIISIDGNNITISASVVLTGQYATQELADLYKQGIMEQWGAISSFTAIDGTEYSVTWNIDVSVNNDIDLDAGDIPKQDGYHNYMQVMCEEYSNGKHVAQSGLNIRTGYTGHVRSYSREGLSLYFDNPMPHEFGHMLGLIDRYYGNKNIRKGPQAYGNVLPGWEGHIMGEKPVDGMAYPSDLNGVVNAAICKIKMRQILCPSAKTTNLGNKYYKEKL